MRRAARIDDNHASIRETLTDRFCDVLDLSPMGRGCPDLLVHSNSGVPPWCYGWARTASRRELIAMVARLLAERLVLIEIKDGTKPPSRRTLTPHQRKFHERWPVSVVNDETEALEAVGLIGEQL